VPNLFKSGGYPIGSSEVSKTPKASLKLKFSSTDSLLVFIENIWLGM